MLYLYKGKCYIKIDAKYVEVKVLKDYRGYDVKALNNTIFAYELKEQPISITIDEAYNYSQNKDKEENGKEQKPKKKII